LGAGVFAAGLQLAFPILGLLLMAEIALALMGRLNQQLHLGISAAPAKMLLTLAALAAVLKVAPRLYENYAEAVFKTIQRTLFG